MKKIALITALSSFAIGAFAADLKTDEQKLSYTIGTQVGESLQVVNDTVKLDEAILFEAITAALQNKKPQLSKEEMDKVLQDMQAKMMAKMKTKMQEDAKANLAEGEKYLADNKAKDGVKVTATGLQYKVISEGKGKKPVATDTVKVSYKGFLPDGTKFDDSADAGGSVEFPLNAVIPGWTEGLQLMSVGSKYEFVIPAKLAYGEMAPPAIGPNRVLRFEVELIDIKAAAKAKSDKAVTEKKPVTETTKATTNKVATETKTEKIPTEKN